MTGPEHYREAERWLANAEQNSGKHADEFYQRQAQVHATLALAAATALGSRERDGDHDPDGMDQRDRAAWERVASDGAA